jgi:hypothetical protein
VSMEGEYRDRTGRELFSGMSEHAQEAVLEGVMRALSSMGVDEPALELLEAVTWMFCLEMFEDFMARVSEFVSEEEMERYTVEETLRLSNEYPEGVPKDVLATACERRAREDYPEAFRVPGRRRK